MRFEERETQVLSVSCDSVHSHRVFAEEMGGITFPMLSDFHPKGEISQSYGVYNPERGTSRRAVFIIDKNGIIRWEKVYEGSLPDNEELLAELDKL